MGLLPFTKNTYDGGPLGTSRKSLTELCLRLISLMLTFEGLPERYSTKPMMFTLA